MINKPLISIITVVFNGEEFLEETIKSVINQTYDNLEYIIIDGGSTDGTVGIIEKYEEEIDYWASDADKGIYDAMNKGIDAATGEWINFMNAGDSFYDVNVLKNIFSKNFDADVVYGLTNRVFPNYQYIKNPKTIETMWRGMRFCHQSMFVKRKIQIENRFSINLINADFEFIYRIYLEGKTFLYLPIVVASFTEGGLSTKNLFRCNYLTYKVANKLKKLDCKQKLFFLSVLSLSFVADVMKKIVPNFLEKYYKLVNLKNKYPIVN